LVIFDVYNDRRVCRCGSWRVSSAINCKWRLFIFATSLAKWGFFMMLGKILLKVVASKTVVVFVKVGISQLKVVSAVAG
jgi:hypothetical protein